MKLLKVTAFLAAILCTTMSIYGQSDVKSFHFKKGEILDILVLTAKPDSGALFETYKKTAFPIAFELSYSPQPGFKISQNRQGNHHPTSFLFGKWDNKQKREKFLEVIDKRVPDFHKQRRNLFSYFALTYYEAQEDLRFDIDKGKYNVVTSYWQKDPATFKKFKNKWLKEVTKHGGQVQLALSNGTSPMGYYYNPTYLTITQWKDKATFDQFYKKNLNMDQSALKHVNQFVIN